MARQIVILETRKTGDGITRVSGFQWFPIAATNARTPRAGFVSAGVALAAPNAITAPEAAALEDGSVREEPMGVEFAASSTTAQIKAELVRRYADRAAAIALEPATRQFYGVSFDGSAWSA